MKCHRHTLIRNAAAMPERLWRGWTDGCGFSVRGALLLPKRRRQVRDPSGSGDRNSRIDACRSPDSGRRHELQETVPGPLITEISAEKSHISGIYHENLVDIMVTASPRKPTFLQRKRWKAVQQAKRKGLLIRGMAKELRIHRNTVRRYIDAKSSPTRRSPASTSDTISD